MVLSTLLSRIRTASQRLGETGKHSAGYFHTIMVPWNYYTTVTNPGGDERGGTAFTLVSIIHYTLMGYIQMSECLWLADQGR